MSRAYHTVAVREDGIWAPQWGSYSKSEANAEIEDMRGSHRRADLRLVTSGDTQPEINAAIAHLNAMSAPIAL